VIVNRSPRWPAWPGSSGRNRDQGSSSARRTSASPSFAEDLRVALRRVAEPRPVGGQLERDEPAGDLDHGVLDQAHDGVGLPSVDQRLQRVERGVDPVGMVARLVPRGVVVDQDGVRGEVPHCGGVHAARRRPRLGCQPEHRRVVAGGEIEEPLDQPVGVPGPQVPAHRVRAIAIGRRASGPRRTHEEEPTHGAARAAAGGRQPVGTMFWFTLNRLVGS
jgi:hypothetical protein